MSLEIHSKPLHESSHESSIETNPASPSKKTRSYKVSFYEGDEVHFIDSHKSLTKKEKTIRWLSSAEFAAHKEDCRRTLKEMKHAPDAGIFTYRGLEMVDPAATAKRQRHNTDTVGAVLIEQRDQRMKGVCQPKAIRKVYKKLVTESMREALENAYMDKKSVQEYLSTTMEELEQQKEKRNCPKRSKTFRSKPRLDRSKSQSRFASLLGRKTVASCATV
jgi:hypothetical protein